MNLTMRKAAEADLLAAEAILMDGKATLKAQGIPQWQGDYPSGVDVASDIEQGIGYVATGETGAPLGYVALSFDGEKTYDVIDGAWLTSSDTAAPRYAVTHRCAVSAAAAHTGVMSFMLRGCERLSRERGCESMRIDTHEKNLPMQGLIAKLGYTACGSIVLAHEEGPDALRLAYEKLLR